MIALQFSRTPAAAPFAANYNPPSKQRRPGNSELMKGAALEWWEDELRSILRDRNATNRADRLREAQMKVAALRSAIVSLHPMKGAI